ncbi:S-formylglutathione hydrolase [Monosporozyma servazzii]
MSFTVNSKIAACGGQFLKLSHQSKVTKCSMDVNVYLPKQYFQRIKNESDKQPTLEKIPTIYYLSGLTCTPQNASEKAFWQIQADNFGFAMVFPDTSPRGDDIPTDPENSWDFGVGAGFYINATKTPFNKNYNMYDYVHNELPNELSKYFSEKNIIDFLDNISITGHSMGGFGAISGFLQNLNKYKSCSAFAPILNPLSIQWGQKAFNGYFNDAKLEGAKYDPTELIQRTKHIPGKEILIHIGTNDPFLKNQLKPELFLEKVKGTEWESHVDLQMVEGFDHSYYFISSFVPQHAEFHAKHLGLLD